jgi:hypothetical protein
VNLKQRLPIRTLCILPRLRDESVASFQGLDTKTLRRLVMSQTVPKIHGPTQQSKRRKGAQRLDRIQKLEQVGGPALRGFDGGHGFEIRQRFHGRCLQSITHFEKSRFVSPSR